MLHSNQSEEKENLYDVSGIYRFLVSFYFHFMDLHRDSNLDCNGVQMEKIGN